MRAAGANVDAIDCVTLAAEAGNIKAVNLVLLGRLSNYFTFSDETWVKAIMDCVPPKLLGVNLKAFVLGRNSDDSFEYQEY
jgi:indolepyruvate ferredoxin oxidoreductase beta subunit